MRHRSPCIGPMAHYTVIWLAPYIGTLHRRKKIKKFSDVITSWLYANSTFHDCHRNTFSACNKFGSRSLVVVKQRSRTSSSSYSALVEKLYWLDPSLCDCKSLAAFRRNLKTQCVLPVCLYRHIASDLAANARWFLPDDSAIEFIYLLTYLLS